MTDLESLDRRPRPGPFRAMSMIGLAACLGLGLFILAVGADLPWLAVLALVAIPGTDLVIHMRVRGYLERHLGVDAVSHALTGLWAAAAVIVYANIAAADAMTLTALTAMSALAIGSMMIALVLWARFPRQLEATGLPGVDSARMMFNWFDRGSRPFTTLERSVHIATLTLETALSLWLLDAGAEALVLLVLAAAAVYLIRCALGAGVAYRRVRHGDEDLRPLIASEVAALAPEILVHFSGSVHATYQLDQWVPYIISSGHASLLIVRELPTYEAVANASLGLPVVFIGEFPDLDLVVPASASLAFYVNTGTRNNQMVRFSHLTHVQLHHGESDKPPSSGKPMRLYDSHFVAGEKAVDRLLEAGAVNDPGAIFIVGRPIIDHIDVGPLDHDTPVVLYAPTWEGYHLDTALTSIGDMSEALVRSIPSTVKLIVRPHPLSGTVDGRLRHKLESLRRVTEARGERGVYLTPETESLVDTMSGADVLIGDVSSVLVDFLGADRPAIVCDVNGLGEDLHVRYPTTAWAGLLDPSLANLPDLLEDALGGDSRRAARSAARDGTLRYVGSAESRFHEVIDSMISRAGESGTIETSTGSSGVKSQ